MLTKISILILAVTATFAVTLNSRAEDKDKDKDKCCVTISGGSSDGKNLEMSSVSIEELGSDGKTWVSVVYKVIKVKDLDKNGAWTYCGLKPGHTYHVRGRNQASPGE